MIKLIIIFLTFIQINMASCNICKNDCHHDKSHKHSDHQGKHSRADLYLPAFMMGDHMDHAGQWMLSIKNMNMDMKGFYEKNHLVDLADFHKKYMMAPLNMSHEMQMYSLMKASKNHTWMLMFSHQEKEMIMQNRMGVQSKMKSKGMGDIKLSYSQLLSFNEQKKNFWTLSLSLPTGDIDQRSMGGFLPYGMQLGSGTWDLKGSYTSRRFFEKHSYSYRVSSLYRIGHNDHQYILGNVYELDMWYTYNSSKKFAPSLRVNYKIEDGIDGLDSSLNPMMSPLNETVNYAFKKLSMVLGFNFSLDDDRSLALEYEMPMLQSYDGFSLGSDSTVVLSYKHLF
ncbi:hypothetical protein MJH12_19490 [bacterium]|nr:hypothetical protein [bacterium]